MIITQNSISHRIDIRCYKRNYLKQGVKPSNFAQHLSSNNMDDFSSTISKSIRNLQNRVFPSHSKQTSAPDNRPKNKPSDRLLDQVLCTSTPDNSADSPPILEDVPELPSLNTHTEQSDTPYTSVEEMPSISVSKAHPSSQDFSIDRLSLDVQLQEFHSSINCLGYSREQVPPPLHTDFEQSSLVAYIDWDLDVSFDDGPIDLDLILDTSFDDSDIDWDVDIAYDESPIDWDLDIPFDNISAVHNLDVSLNESPIDWHLETSSYEMCKDDSVSTPVRLVVDPTMMGLNLCSPKGENRIAKIFDIVVEGRCYLLLWSAGIGKMYNRLKVKPSLLAYQLMLFDVSLDPNTPPKIAGGVAIYAGF